MGGGDGGSVRGREMGSHCLMGADFPFGGDEMSQKQTEVIIAQHRECNKCRGSTHFKTVHG